MLRNYLLRVVVSTTALSTLAAIVVQDRPLQESRYAVSLATQKFKDEVPRALATNAKAYNKNWNFHSAVASNRQIECVGYRNSSPFREPEKITAVYKLDHMVLKTVEPLTFKEGRLKQPTDTRHAARMLDYLGYSGETIIALNNEGKLLSTAQKIASAE